MALGNAQVSDLDRTQFMHVLAESLNSDAPDEFSVDQPKGALEAWADVFTLLAAGFHDAVNASRGSSPRSGRRSADGSPKRSSISEMPQSDVFTIDEVILVEDV
jgi:hypothetical protein